VQDFSTLVMYFGDNVSFI